MEVVEKASGNGELLETAASAANGEGVAQVEEPQPWAISDAEAASRAGRYRAIREQRGAWAADRILRSELQDAGVPYQRLQQEVDRIQRLVN
jgi:hypothetical protein